MTKELKMETIMPQENKEEAVEILNLLDAMNLAEQQEMLAFVRGVRFGMSLGVTGTDRTAV